MSLPKRCLFLSSSFYHTPAVKTSTADLDRMFIPNYLRDSCVDVFIPLHKVCCHYKLEHLEESLGSLTICALERFVLSYYSLRVPITLW